jgi:hypothetical protein
VSVLRSPNTSCTRTHTTHASEVSEKEEGQACGLTDVPCAGSNEAVVDFGAMVEDGDGVEQAGQVARIYNLTNIRT